MSLASSTWKFIKWIHFKNELFCCFKAEHIYILTTGTVLRVSPVRHNGHKEQIRWTEQDLAQ